MDDGRFVLRRSASRLTLLAQFFGLLALILMLVWLLHYREGLNLDSGNSNRIFNVHPFLMYFGFIFFAGQAMMAYKTIPSEWEVKKFFHMFLHLIAFVLGIVGLSAAFKFHDMVKVQHMTTLHSWIGMVTFCLFGLQWLFGFAIFLFPNSRETRARARPWHVSFGRALLYMAICAAETGLMNKSAHLRLGDSSESHLINVTGLCILFFGIMVDLCVVLAGYVY